MAHSCYFSIDLFSNNFLVKSLLWLAFRVRVAWLRVAAQQSAIDG